MKYLVTGGAGFIGAHLVEKLIPLGEVVVIDNLSALGDNFHFSPGADYFTYDICDDRSNKLYEGVDYVFHLAAESRLQLAMKNPVKAVEKNVLGTAKVLEFARRYGVKRVIYSSTSSVYGNGAPPHKESDTPDPLNMYSQTKLMGEKLCLSYTDQYDLDTVILRYFNVYGPRSPLIGQYSPVIGIFEEQVKRGIPLTVVGSGKQQRDFVHVEDVADANILMTTSDGAVGEIFNVGAGKPTRIIDVAKSFKTDITFVPERKGEMVSSFADIHKISRLGFKPERSL